jgi:hypothetical protein
VLSVPSCKNFAVFVFFVVQKPGSSAQSAVPSVRTDGPAVRPYL